MFNILRNFFLELCEERLSRAIHGVWPVTAEFIVLISHLVARQSFEMRSQLGARVAAKAELVRKTPKEQTVIGLRRGL